MLNLLRLKKKIPTRRQWRSFGVLGGKVTHFRPKFLFWVSWKLEKIKGFLTFSGSLEDVTLAENGLSKLYLLCHCKKNAEKQKQNKLWLYSRNSQNNVNLFYLLKFLMMFSIKSFGYPASVYLLLILLVSLWKSEAILLALCSSSVISFFLYLKGTLEDQCTGNVFTSL